MRSDLHNRAAPLVLEALKPGEKVIDDPGEPALTTSVTRDVYDEHGKLFHHDVWYSTYRAVPELVRIGPKLRKPKRPRQPPRTQ
ncbi:MAG: hypothetical protein ACYDCH_08090 [Gaiellaceae bacterium]